MAGVIAFLSFIRARSIGSRSWAIPGRVGNSCPGTLAAARVWGGPGRSSSLSPGSKRARAGSGSGGSGTGDSGSGVFGSGDLWGSGVVLSSLESS